MTIPGTKRMLEHNICLLREHPPAALRKHPEVTPVHWGADLLFNWRQNW